MSLVATVTSHTTTKPARVSRVTVSSLVERLRMYIELKHREKAALAATKEAAKSLIPDMLRVVKRNDEGKLVMQVDNYRVQLVESEGRVGLVDDAIDILGEEIAHMVTKRVIDTAAFDAAVKLGIISSELLEAVTVIKPTAPYIRYTATAPVSV